MRDLSVQEFNAVQGGCDKCPPSILLIVGAAVLGAATFAGTYLKSCSLTTKVIGGSVLASGLATASYYYFQNDEATMQHDHSVCDHEHV